MFQKKKNSSENVAEGEQKLIEEVFAFEEVLGDELKLLDELRDAGVSQTHHSVYQCAHGSNLAGLAFSGGGIRSATFNLGVIQALSRYGLLSKFDYLSTVSGGGFIGGWLSALLHRQALQNGKVDERAVRDFQENLKTHPDESRLGKTVGFKAVEHKAVRYLRGYSNYLSPRLGLSGDALAAAAIFLRNFVLIQLTLVSLVASVLLVAHVVGAASMAYKEEEWLIGVSLLALAVAIISAGWLSAGNRLNRENPAGASLAVSVLVIFPVVVAAWAFCVAIVTPTNPLHPGQHGVTGDAFWWWMVAGAAGYGVAWLVGYRTTKWRRHCEDKRRPKERREEKRCKEKTEVPASKDSGVSDEDSGSGFKQLLAATFSGALLGLLMYTAVRMVLSVAQIDMWHAVAFGPPLFLLGMSFVVTVHIGVARRAFSEQDREWFARLGGFVLWLCAAWTLLFALVLYATPLVQWLAGGGLVALVTWAAGSGLGAWLAHGPSTGGKTGGIPWKEIAARIAPWLFLAGLGVIVAYATHMVLLNFVIHDRFPADVYARSCDTDFCVAAGNALGQLRALPWPGTLGALGVTLFVFFLMVWRLDINLFSLHAMYCNRIARAFLGASCPTERQPNPFTGFDPEDDLPFHELDCQRPIPIINTAINMTGGDDLAWQTRHAASFAFTPVWAGFETRSTQGAKLGAYRHTAEYAGGRTLGTLMAVSGAAASPNMGYHTSAGVAALMTAFNLRLGRWCGNPARDNVWKMTSPGPAARPIFAELTGSATAQANWINLTDGGHFDNLGVYELIRRRCRLIVVTDAGCDPEYQFEDLANTIRKCWTDLGVNIRFEDFEPMHRLKDSRYCGVHGAVGRIQYYDDLPDGAIIYLKSSMTGDEWPDIRQYADTHEDFPHESTADQFFDENQFEAYRHLGYKVVAKMIVALAKFSGRDPEDVRNFSIADLVTSLLAAAPQRKDET